MSTVKLVDFWGRNWLFLLSLMCIRSICKDFLILMHGKCKMQFVVKSHYQGFLPPFKSIFFTKFSSLIIFASMIPHIYLVALCTCAAGFTFGYDIGVISGVLTQPLFLSQMGITADNAAERIGNIASAMQVGGFGSIFISAYVNDFLGRKLTIILFSLVFIVGGILQTLSYDICWMYAGRIVSGFGLTTMMISCSMFNAEMAPRKIRGRIIGIQQLMVTFGIATSYWVNYAVTLSTSFTNNQLKYQLPLLLQIFPSVMLIIGMFFIPKSPRWLCYRGEIDEARVSLSKIRQMPVNSSEISAEILEILAACNQNDNSTWKEVFGPINVKRLFVAVSILGKIQVSKMQYFKSFVDKISSTILHQLYFKI